MKIELRERVGHLLSHRYAMEVFIPMFSVGFTHGYFKASLRDGGIYSTFSVGYTHGYFKASLRDGEKDLVSFSVGFYPRLL